MLFLFCLAIIRCTWFSEFFAFIKLRQQKLQYCKDPGKVAFAVVPSGAARKILTEFSLRYGIVSIRLND